jgi:hypothetical protein
VLIVLDRERQHGEAIERARDRRLAVAGLAGRDPQQFREPETLQRRLRDREMRVVDRIERAAENP